MTPHTIYFVRHGETEWNAAGRIQGRCDSPLTPLGREQAVRNGRALREILDSTERFHFVASPLGRTLHTMQLIRAELGLPAHGFTTDERLAELGYGEWEGQTWREIRSSRAQEVEAMYAARWTFRAAGGESFHDVAERLRSWVTSLNHDVVVVSHGGIGRIFRGLFHGMPTSEIPDLPNLVQDRIYRFANGSEATL